ncbi:MAG: class I SAM-dependent methyltransferase [Anaerolineales bacterium]|nr:class I SAM-dependent methyltransferase [Anaerolineales bacterium]
MKKESKNIPTTRMYSDLAHYFHLLTAPEDYAEEAAFYCRVLTEACIKPPRTLLELGSGGGNNASHLKSVFQLTLTDLSSHMLALSQTLNPECEHIQGDMRTLRLERLFDAVFIHDAITYMTSLDDLQKALETAFIHCEPGGAALFAPDFTRETFRPATEHGGHDGKKQGMRFLEWTWDPDPHDTTYLVDYAFLLRNEQGVMHMEYDRHELGLFSRLDWLHLIEEVGFQAKALPFEHSEAKPGDEIFLGIKTIR